MNLLLGFAPFLLFAVLMQLSPSLALWVAFAAAFALGIRSFLESRILKTLDWGSVALFGLLAVFAEFIPPNVTLSTVRLAVDGGLLIIVVVSLVLREPFTLQYAREQAPRELWSSAPFIRTNYVVTIVWAAAFAIMTAADAAATFTAQLPLAEAVMLGLAALAGALTFTYQYPAYVRRRIGNRPK
jgi:hypothetical protein